MGAWRPKSKISALLHSILNDRSAVLPAIRPVDISCQGRMPSKGGQLSPFGSMRAGRQEGGVMPGSASPVGPLVADVSACAELLPGLRPWVRSRKKTQLPPIRGHDHASHAARPAGAAEAPLR